MNANMSDAQQTYSVPSPPTSESGQVTIILLHAGKRFNRDWIFRQVNYQFETGRSYAVTGPNGSGKSTLLQAIAGSLYLSEGKLDYQTELKETDEQRNKEKRTSNS